MGLQEWKRSAYNSGMNILFEYLYRDAGNFKRWGEIVFTNVRELSCEEIEEQVRENLIDSEFFVAVDAGVPELYFDEHIEAQDHGWHQYSSVSLTEYQPTDSKARDISEFIVALATAKAKAV